MTPELSVQEFQFQCSLQSSQCPLYVTRVQLTVGNLHSVLDHLLLFVYVSVSQLLRVVCCLLGQSLKLSAKAYRDVHGLSGGEQSANQAVQPPMHELKSPVQQQQPKHEFQSQNDISDEDFFAAPSMPQPFKHLP